MSKPLEKIEDGITWHLQACGHYQGNVKESRYGLCPNCEFLARLGISIEIKHPELMPKVA
jgi:hypothetical protein